MKEIMRNKDQYNNEIDIYFSLIEHVIIQLKAKDFVMISDEIDQKLIIQNY